MSNLNDGFYDESYSEDLNPSWSDIIVISLMVALIFGWQKIKGIFVKARKKIEFKSEDNEYADWFENQRP